MNNPAKLSRRDWFRLRIPHQNKMLDEANADSPEESSKESRSSNSNGLKPIEHPPNHDGLDLSKLPPMREATLSTEQITALFADIQELGTEILLMQRGANAQKAEASKVDCATQLETAKSALLSGAIPRLQIRYRWQDQQWIDTVKRETDGFHIVRIAHQSI